MLVEQVRPPRQGALLDITGPLPEEIGAFLMQAARLGKKGALQVDHALLTYGPEFHLQASTPAALPTQLALRLLQEEPDGTGHAFIPDGGKAGL
jgi:hypothetical protein